MVLPGASQALARVHVGEGIFSRRREGSLPVESNPMILLESQYEQTRGVFVIHDRPVQLYPGVCLTGLVPRKYSEHNWSGNGQVITPDGLVNDNVLEDMAMVFDTDQRLVVLTGCGHAGVVNLID